MILKNHKRQPLFSAHLWFFLAFADCYLPYKLIAVCVCLYFRTVNKGGRFLKGYCSMLHRNLNRLVQQILHCVRKLLAAKPGNGIVIRRTMPLQKIHGVYILSAGSLNFP